MVDHALDVLDDDVAEVWGLAENVEHLPEDEIRTIEIYLARRALIDATRGELYESPDPEV